VSVLERAQQLAAQGRQADAVALVARASERGDPDAQFAVANWRLFGIHGARDLKAVHKLLDLAVRQKHGEATLLKATLLGNGTGCAVDEDRAIALLRSLARRSAAAAAQLALIDQMAPADAGPPGVEEILCEDPHVRAVRGLLTGEECGYLMSQAERHLQPSFVFHPLTGQRMPHPTRTSMGMNFGPSLEDLAVRRINQRLARVSGTALPCGEPLHILRYTEGQEYKPHMDVVPGEANQRAWTVLVYLNDGYAGGSTRFHLLGVEFAGRTGDALVFTSLDANGRPDPRSRHAGLPITGGVKWLATRWIRSRPFEALPG
jgi:prolyl 4-hydroxylase